MKIDNFDYEDELTDALLSLWVAIDKTKCNYEMQQILKQIPDNIKREAIKILIKVINRNEISGMIVGESLEKLKKSSIDLIKEGESGNDK